jgi:hypothetical protein
LFFNKILFFSSSFLNDRVDWRGKKTLFIDAKFENRKCDFYLSFSSKFYYLRLRLLLLNDMITIDDEEINCCIEIRKNG